MSKYCDGCGKKDNIVVTLEYKSEKIDYCEECWSKTKAGKVLNKFK